ncbi:SDR family oxidoreductase [Pseudorhodoferax sp. Leaf265]|uniref:SDR family oxidoreductase n=1 Tax=Pseudorhodoferax sp. Leaf265 TaxID=1736315 RepID=UPI0006F2DD69|nr:SDR family oxidoreductase [Pseudorhodoferax sp. Leaf265]KQP06213.1 short-chain dehydrogenase [Pseudorhodoferax sp. Leaf265]
MQRSDRASTFAPDLLRGKVAVVAGASGGINLGIAQALAHSGCAVVVLSRDQGRIDAAARSIVALGGRALGCAADVRDFDAVDAVFRTAVQTYGPVDIVVSGAAGNFHAPAAHLSANGFKTVIDIDLIGGFNVLRAAFPHLRKPGASLLSVTAPGAVRPSLFQVHANAAKAGINMMTQCLAMEWGPAGVRVNAVSPGPIAGTEGMARLASTPEREQAIKSRLALRDYGRIEDIAQTALFLCSDAARYITGSIVDCDGGSVLGDASGDALSAPPARAG